MLIVLSYCHRDYLAAMKLAEFLGRKTDLRGHEFMFYGSSGARGPAGEAVQWLNGADRLHVWRSPKDVQEYPLGPNMMVANFREQMVKFGEEVIPDTIFLIESDAFPTCRDWAHRVERAHADMELAVSGQWVDWSEPNHVNGSLVMGRDALADNAVLGRPVLTAWDVHHAELLAPFGAKHDNPEVMLARKAETYMPNEWWRALKKNGKTPAWIHGCRGFAMIEYLMANGFENFDGSKT